MPGASEAVNEESKTEENDQDDQTRSTEPLESVQKSCLAKPEGHGKSATSSGSLEGLQVKFAEAVHSTNALDMQSVNFFECEEDLELNVASDVPEFVDMDVAVDSGAGDNVLAAVDAPGHKVQESPGSRNGQNFKGAG